jgi:hypothetical protein
MAEKSDEPQIDKIRAKFDANKPLSLREVCFVLWAELYVCSTQYYMFAHWVKTQGATTKSKFGWPIWKSMFYTFAEGDWKKMEKDYDLIASVKKQSANRLFGKLE